MNLVWTGRALAELDAALAYIATDSPASAEQAGLQIERRAALLRQYPEIGRPGRIEGTRELVVTGMSYILPYRVREGRVEILAVLHTSRQWPDQI